MCEQASTIGGRDDTACGWKAGGGSCRRAMREANREDQDVRNSAGQGRGQRQREETTVCQESQARGRAGREEGVAGSMWAR